MRVKKQIAHAKLSLILVLANRLRKATIIHNFVNVNVSVNVSVSVNVLQIQNGYSVFRISLAVNGQ